MKRTIFLLILSALLLSACGAGRDLSTPSSRLVGHWISSGFTKAEYYFSEINKETGLGKITEYAPRTGTVATGTYKIASEKPGGEEITLSAIWSGYEELPDDHIEFNVSVDGLTAKMHEFTITYVDDKTEFDLADLKPTDTPETPTQTPTLDPSITIYQVAMDGVGFYETPTSDNAQYALDMEDRLIPADGATTAQCTATVRNGTNINMCHMYSPRLGVDGWIWRFMIVEVD